MGLFTEVYIYGPFYRSVHLCAFLQKCTSMGLFTEVYIYECFYRSVHLWAFLQKCTSMGLFTEAGADLGGVQGVQVNPPSQQKL